MMKKNPKVAFIIVCWNNSDILSECFDSIKNQSYENHVTIMVDNNSKDKSVTLTKDNFPWVVLYESKENLGFAKGNNVGIKYAIDKYQDVEYFVLINTDARIKDNWLKEVVDFANMKPKGALFQSVTLDYYDHKVIDSTHIYISRNGSGTQGSWRAPFNSPVGPRRVFGVNAAVAMVSRRFIEAQPFKTLFDEKFFMYLEDVDISARATVMGWDNYLVSGTEAYHMGSASSNKNPGFSLYMTYRNNIALLIKNIPLSILLRMVPGIIKSDYHTILHLKHIGKSKAIPMLIKGRLVGFLRLPLYIPGIISMRKYRKSISEDYLWQLMHKGH